MVAYSFKKIFIPAIEIGLGLRPLDGEHQPKRQTIRAIGLRRHARPGETLQLYTAMRTKQCELIGKARCVSVGTISIMFPKTRRRFPKVWIAREQPGGWIVDPAELEAFAAQDGFATWADLQEFWRVNHPGVTDFSGMLIRWSP